MQGNGIFNTLVNIQKNKQQKCDNLVRQFIIIIKQNSRLPVKHHLPILSSDPAPTGHNEFGLRQ